MWCWINLSGLLTSLHGFGCRVNRKYISIPKLLCPTCKRRDVLFLCEYQFLIAKSDCVVQQLSAEQMALVTAEISGIFFV